MTELKIETHVQRFSKVVDRVLDYSGGLQSDGGMDTSLAVVAMAQEELLQLRAELSQPYPDLREQRIVSNDQLGLEEFLKVNPRLTTFNYGIICSQSGRIVEIKTHNGVIASLAPLEILSGLERLCFNNMGFLDISPLSTLSSLRRLETYHNTELDSKTLLAMPRLEHLVCSGSARPIEVFRWISGCINLRSLVLSASGIESLEELIPLKSLETLEISWDTIPDLAPLKLLPALKKLSIDSLQQSSCEILLELPALEQLTLKCGVSEDINKLIERGVRIDFRY